MSSLLAPLLVIIAQATSPAAYLEAQDKASAVAGEHYEELRAEASSNPDPVIRIEALGLVELLSQPDAEALLLRSVKEDADPAVAEHAKALLFRATVARNARNSGQMSEVQYQTYRATSRRLSAEAMFRPAAPAPK